MTRTPYQDAVHYQTQAADPTRNVFVSANAGSGKTHVLVNRVSRILLSSTEMRPEDILCLTYTKAAAAEMQTRLFTVLGEWSVMAEADLQAKLDALYQQHNVPVDLKLARQLFAKALETPEGLKVQTIHAFCERLLARFPIEAGILPGFEPLDEGDAAALFEDVWRGLLSRAFNNPSAELAHAIAALMGETANSTIESLRGWMAGHLRAIESWSERGGMALVYQHLGVEAGESVAGYKARIWAQVDTAALRAAAQDLSANDAKKQGEVGQACLRALSEADPVRAFDLYKSAVFKTDGSAPNSQIGGKKFGPAVDAFFGPYRSLETPEMQRLGEASEYLAKLQIAAQTEIIFTIATAFVRDYAREKKNRRVLDFSDQIHLVADLLQRSEVSQWVRYKLDMGIKHILVDEAQDTSQIQWDIIDALSEAFAHDEDQSVPRTLFAVGDEKQSIYSFQGADPTVFIRKAQSENTEDAAIRMRMSFRSAPAVLRVVDSVFVDGQGAQAMFDPGTIIPASDLITHSAHRDIAGLVELWPLAPPPDKIDDEMPWDPRPVDSDAQDSAREKLAREIAQQIKRWLDTGEPVTARRKDAGKTVDYVRPMRAGDILILVRKRSGTFFNAVIRHLKQAGVAVAGADRLVLSDSIAVQDLMSLAKFACLPEDDLSLAEALKSPLFDWSDDDLFKVAHGRNGRLWRALQESEHDFARTATERLRRILSLSRRYAPYEFFEGVLNMTGADGGSTLRQFYARLSMEVEDPITAFLARALAHQRREAPSLQHFVQSFGNDSQELKREMDEAGNQVRVMTVYGAKGLEAPVVILPDTSQSLTSRVAMNAGILALDGGSFVRPGGALDRVPSLAAARDQRLARAIEEDMRLLYVAMTRAESRLLICGYFSGSAGEKNNYGRIPDAGSWHEWTRAAIERLDGCHPIETPFDSDYGAGIAYGTRPVMTETHSEPIAAKDAVLPPWITQSLGPPPASARRVTPSHLLAPPPGLDAPLRSPLETPVPVYRRGTLIHKLLELLPDLAPEARAQAADLFLSGHKDLPQSLCEDIKSVSLAVLSDPRFAEIFAPGSRAEVSLAGRADSLPRSIYLNAQIDRLAVTETQVFIVDYKSNRPPPTDPVDVADSYLGQMAAYRELARTIYPDKTVVCGLLWTDGPDMMILPDELLDSALAKIPS